MKYRSAILLLPITIFLLGLFFLFNGSAQAQSASYSFQRDLSVGDIGADVAQLQAFLISKGFLKVSGPTGYFGAATANAVSAWQTSVGLPATGYFGNLSEAAINNPNAIIVTPAPKVISNANSSPSKNTSVDNITISTSTTNAVVNTTNAYSRNLTLGDEGSDVNALQSFLITKGFLFLTTPTGYFGAITQSAVAAWQTSLAIPSTGYFGTISRTDIQTSYNSSTLAAKTSTATSKPASISSQISTPSIVKTAPTTTPHAVINFSGGGGGGGGGGNAPAPMISAPADTMPPAVAITNPTTSSTLVGIVSISITASDNVGVARVEFYTDGILKASSNSASSPYSFPLNTGSLSLGSHTLTAKAYDAAGNVGTSANIQIMVITPTPTIPLNPNITANTSSSISLAWSSANEIGGAISGYAIYRNSVQVASTSATSFTDINLTASTTYSYVIESYDTQGIFSGASTIVSTTTISPTPTLNYKYGISLGENPVYWNTATLHQVFSNLQTLGVGWIRFDIEWNHVQPNNSSAYNWAGIDAVISAANAYHLKVLPILDFVPSWAASSSCASDDSHCAPSDPNLFATFAEAAVQRYASQGVSDWEIWNEPNNAQFWGPTTNCGAYTNLLKATYPAIKQAEPDAVVITGGLSPAGTDGTNMSPPDFLSCVYSDGGQNYFDAVGDHPYTFPSSPASDNGGAWDQMFNNGSGSLRGIMTANGDAGKQIWVTEFGAPTNGPDSHWYVSEAGQAQMVTDAIAAYSAYSWGGPFFWYTYQDSGTSTSTNENFFGLLRYDGSTKPAYTTLQSLIVL